MTNEQLSDHVELIIFIICFVTFNSHMGYKISPFRLSHYCKSYFTTSESSSEDESVMFVSDPEYTQLVHDYIIAKRAEAEHNNLQCTCITHQASDAIGREETNQKYS